MDREMDVSHCLHLAKRQFAKIGMPQLEMVFKRYVSKREGG